MADDDVRTKVARVFQEHSNAVLEGRFGTPTDWADRVLDIERYFGPQSDSHELVRDWDAFSVAIERLSEAERKLAAVAKFADTLEGYSESWPTSPGKLVASQLRELL